MGPLELMVLAFPKGELPLSAVAAVGSVRTSGQVRLIDSLVVFKTPSGEVSTAELVDYEEFGEAFGGPDAINLIGPEDAEEAAETLDPGTCALLLLVEHLWAQEAAETVREAGGAITARIGIPMNLVDEAHAAFAGAGGRS
ncbi:DUF6325 family protein [Streptacidiphilus jiangxiensis]|uniref:DUF1269 domain-containing protein n=1 Tax=Streptacidiphilus jiangxiensis TaxID=235985 RepID=A0A1H7HUH6_STRJI|nr:DUF6325 family protein [Streptacidiphilus jiangxiensis]SEK53317.1 hypothetical protein SAMN05414137_102340 [Streptacidiphilus jiangxiensis]